MKLFEPANLANLQLRNRIVMPPMGTGLGNNDGSVSERMIDYYRRRASGAGMILVEACNIDRTSFEGNLTLWDDRFINGLSLLTEAIKGNGAKAGLQLAHSGGQALSKVTGVQPVAPSPVQATPNNEIPRELTLAEIEDLIDQFTKAAERAQKAGFDLIELHGAHGYLIAQFFSPYTNLRRDMYGGDVTRRSNFAIHCIQRIKDKLGRDFPISVRISGAEYFEGGLIVDEAKVIAQQLEQAGADAVHVSGGSHRTFHYGVQPMMLPRGVLMPATEAIKKVLRIPVIAVGRINNIELAEKILNENKADFISMGRALMVDPDFPKKYRENRTEEIQHCIACNTCIDRMFDTKYLIIACTINPEVTNERKFVIEKARTRKKVMVVGGGPGGMEAARILAMRGHEVELYERDGKLGGRWNLAKIPFKNEEWTTGIQFFEKELERLRVPVFLNQEITEEFLLKKRPDAVILATGAHQILPEIKDNHGKHLSADEFLGKRTEVGKEIVILGGNEIGCEIAIFLAEKGKHVTIVEPESKIGLDVGRSIRYGIIFPEIEELGIRVMKRTEVREIKDGKVRVKKDSKTGDEEVIFFDHLIVAHGYLPSDELYKKLKDRIEIYCIGDCNAPRRSIDAIHEAVKIATQI